MMTPKPGPPARGGPLPESRSSGGAPTTAQSPERAREQGFLLAALDAVIMIDENGEVVEFNPSAEKTFGYSRREAIGRTVAELIVPPSLRADHQAAFQRFVNTREGRIFGRRVEITGMRSDGTEFPVELALSHIEGEPLLICGALRDVSADKRLREDLRKLADEQTALRQVATLVARETDQGALFESVCASLGGLMGAARVSVIQREDGSTKGLMTWENPHADSVHPQEPSPIAINAPTLSTSNSGAAIRASGSQDAGRYIVDTPILMNNENWGSLVVESDDLPPSGSDQTVARFADMISTSITRETARSQLFASRARIVTAGDEARRQIQRNIHDGAQQRIVASVIDLQLADERFDSDPTAARAALRSALRTARDGLQELRELAAGLHPRILARGGLPAALDTLAGQCRLPVAVAAPNARYSPQLEAAVYFVVAEALTNVAKHANASCARVEVTESKGDLVVSIEDDGMGGADPEAGSGLRGLSDRTEALGGYLRVDSQKGHGTILTASLPIQTGAAD
jgi:PAS domain S-box-containing protein